MIICRFVLLMIKPRCTGQSLSGLKIYAPKKALGKFGKFHIEEILLAMPSVGRARKKEMIEFFELADVKIMELPGRDPTGRGAGAGFRYP